MSLAALLAAAALAQPAEQAAEPASEPVIEVVKVRAERLEPSPREGAFAIETVDTEQMKSSVRLDEQLRQIPGFGLFRRTSSELANPTIQGASLRGIGPNGAGRALVTLDDVPLNDPFGGWIYWSRVPPARIEAVRVTRGGGAVTAGPGALTGAIALDSRLLAPGSTELDVKVGERGYVSAAGNVGLGVREGLVSLFASADRSGGAIPVEPSRRGPVDIRAGLDAWSLAAGVMLPVGPNTISARISGFSEERDSGIAGASSAASGVDASAAIRGPFQGGEGRLLAYVQLRDFANAAAAAAPDRRTATPTLDQVETPALGVGVKGAWRIETGTGEFETGFEARHLDGESRERFRFLNGAFTRDRTAGGAQTLIGAYAEGRIDRGRWRFLTGGRIDGWANTQGRREERDRATGLPTLSERPKDADGVVVSWRLGSVLALTQTDELRAAAYSGFRPANLNELHRPFRLGNDVTEANAALKPETLTGLEIGWSHSGELAGLEATLFWNRLDDAIANVTLATGPGTFPRVGFLPAGGAFRERRNAGSIDAAGLELSGVVQATDALALRGALAWIDAEVDGGTALPALTGRRPAQTAELTATAGVTFSPTPEWRAGIALRHETSRFEDDLNSRVLDPYTVIDATLSRQIGQVELSLAADNLADERVETGRGGDGVATLTPGRTVRVGVVWRRP